MNRPTILRAQVHAARVSATCDGDGLVTLPTEDGPEHYTCPGCRQCAPSLPPVPARPMTDPFARLPIAMDDEPW